MHQALASYYRCFDESLPAEPLLEAKNSSDRLPLCDESGAVGLLFDGGEFVGRLKRIYDIGDSSEILEIAEQLRSERYVSKLPAGDWLKSRLARRAYYGMRSWLPHFVRLRLQRLYFHGWRKQSFPSWPVDTTVDELFEHALLQQLQSYKVKEIPFIWFWPEGHAGCVMVTHDVETRKGYEYCPKLMDLDEQAGIRSSFQLIPEGRYTIAPEFVQEMRRRGFEVNAHDFNHDGHLYANWSLFASRAEKINRWAKDISAKGFRSGVLYRNQDWYSAFDFEFDMSVPNVGHLEVQRGGCCTVMPYFIGQILELPLTTSQDYTLFEILRQYSTELWQSQVELILRRHGLISFLSHPDYILEQRANVVYKSLLEFISHLRHTENVWVALPSAVNHWWRQRARMSIVKHRGALQVIGSGCEHAQLAFARLEHGRVVYRIEGEAQNAGPFCTERYR